MKLASTAKISVAHSPTNSAQLGSVQSTDLPAHFYLDVEPLQADLCAQIAASLVVVSILVESSGVESSCWDRPTTRQLAIEIQLTTRIVQLESTDH